MINLYIVDNKGWRASVFGIGTYINELSLILEKSEINTTIIYLNSISPKVLQVVENGINYWHIPSPKLKSVNNSKHYDCYYKSVVFLLKKYIKDQENIIFQLNYLDFSPLATVLKDAFACKIILAIHFFTWCFDLQGSVNRLQKIIHQQDSDLDNFDRKVKESFNSDKDFLYSADKVLCLSQHAARILEKLYKVKKQKISIIYNGLKDKKQKEVDKVLIKRKYNLPIDTPVIIFAGRLDPIKGLSYLIRASKIVLDQFPNCQIIIAGSGDYDSYMKECGNKWMNIHFTGFLEKSELYELYSIADLGVMPSLYEPFGYVAVEMMMHELPIVATATSGLNEVVDEFCGMKVPLTVLSDSVEIDTSLLAQKILCLLLHPAEAKKMGRNGRKRYLKEYSSDVFRKNMLKFYNSL